MCVYRFNRHADNEQIQQRPQPQHNTNIEWEKQTNQQPKMNKNLFHFKNGFDSFGIFVAAC